MLIFQGKNVDVKVNFCGNGRVGAKFHFLSSESGDFNVKIDKKICFLGRIILR